MKDLSALFDRFSEEAVLADLPTQQTEAIITLLVVIMYADNVVTASEREELGALVGRLPFYADKQRMARELEVAIATAGDRRTEETLRAIIDALAVHVSDREVRQATYRMAVAMSRTDGVVQDEEDALLGWLAAAFNLDLAFVEAADAGV